MLRVYPYIEGVEAVDDRQLGGENLLTLCALVAMIVATSSE